MANDMNVYMLVGRLTRDAENRQSDSGWITSRFAIANGYRDRNRDTGEWEDRTNFFECRYLSKGTVCEYLKKGTQVAVTGELRDERFTRKDGTPGREVCVIVHGLQLLGSKASQTDAGVPEDPRTQNRTPGRKGDLQASMRAAGYKPEAQQAGAGTAVKKAVPDPPPFEGPAPDISEVRDEEIPF